MHWWNWNYVLGMVLLGSLLPGCQPEEPEPEAPFRPGERILFFGDSITQAGAEPGGYVSLVADSLREAYPDLDVEVIGAGISGNKVPDLLERVERDVLAQDPTTVVVYIGINDVWHWTMPSGRGTTEIAFEEGLRTLVDTLQAGGADVLLCTPSVIGERVDGRNEQDGMLDAYSEISRDVAADLDVHTCDLRAAFIDYLREHNVEDAEEGVLTTDGVHLNERGNRFVARQMIQALEEAGRE